MTDSDDFVSRLDADLRVMAGTDAELAAEEEDIRGKRAELRVRMADLTRLRDMYRDYMGLRPVEQPDKGLFDMTVQMPRTGTIADLAFAAVKQHGGRMRVREIQDALTEVGKLKGGHGDYGTLFGSLSRDPRFRKVDRGVFQIAESPNGQQAHEDS